MIFKKPVLWSTNHSVTLSIIVNSKIHLSLLFTPCFVFPWHFTKGNSTILTMFLCTTCYGFNANLTVPSVLSIYWIPSVKWSSGNLNVLLSGEKKKKEIKREDFHPSPLWQKSLNQKTSLVIALKRTRDLLLLKI